MINLYFRTKGEDDEDIIDSDFSIDENDEPVSDHDDDAPKRKKKVVTRSYKVRNCATK